MQIQLPDATFTDADVVVLKIIRKETDAKCIVVSVHVDQRVDYVGVRQVAARDRVP